jgi:DNA-binding LytR/AlgR family response regulator
MEKHILIVEDEILIAKGIKNALISNNYNQVSIAVSYQGALNIINANQIDLVLLDIKINSTETGLDIAQDLKKLQIPFLFLTSFNDSKTLDEILALNPIGYINKPVNKFTLLSTITLFFKNTGSKPQELLTLIDGTKTYQININNLMYVETDHVYINLFMIDAKIYIRNSLTKFLSTVPNKRLVQINRSTAINPEFITEKTKSNIKLSQKEFKISSVFKEEVEKTLNNYFNIVSEQKTGVS